MIGIKVWIVKSWNLNIAIVNANLINCSLTTSFQTRNSEKLPYLQQWYLRIPQALWK